MVRAAIVLLLLVVVGGTAHAYTLNGTVFADTNGDGVQEVGEAGVANAVVAYDTAAYARTAADGTFSIAVPTGGTGNVWVRVPDGFTPGPVYENVGALVGGVVALGVRPRAPSAGPLTFVVTSDSHMTAAQPFANDLTAAVQRATALSPPPAFFAITGDITQGDTDDEFDLVNSQLAPIAVPFVKVPGNHDWYDGGVTYRRRYGPDNYSFDIGNVHFLVWNMNLPDGTLQAYLRTELSYVDPGMTVVAMTHAPPAPNTIATLEAAGVDYVLSGHTHTNRVVDHHGTGPAGGPVTLHEVNFEPFLMGGLDFTPGGYRVVTIDDTGALTSVHRTTIDAPFVHLVGTSTGDCLAPAAGGLVFAAAEVDAGEMTVTATVVGATEGIPATSLGGWAYSVPVPPLGPGTHTIHFEAHGASGDSAMADPTVTVCTPIAAPETAGDWAQAGGGADHRGETAMPIASPLVGRWTAATGGTILQSAPVIAGGVVYAVASDLADGTTGGVSAFDLATGTQLWRAPAQTRGGVAVDGDIVIVAQQDGTVLGLHAATGEVAWGKPLSDGIRSEAAFISATPAVDDGRVFIGNEHAFVALATADGSPTWTTDPLTLPFDFSTDDAMAIGGGLVVGSFTRASGLSAWDAETGELEWNVTTDHTTGVNGSPVIDADAGVVYIVDAEDEVIALDLETGAERWHALLDPMGFVWGNAIAAAPALSDGVLAVPTLYGDLVGVAAADGKLLWRHAGTASALRTTHYRGNNMAGWEGSPVIAAGVVWAADTSGTLVALDLHSGDVLWSTELGAPVLAGLAASDHWIVAATFDGTIHAFSATPGLQPGLSTGDDGGCCQTGGAAPSAPVLCVALGLLLRRRRKT